MAKTKKTKPIEPDVIEEVVEVIPDEEVTEATTEIADRPIEVIEEAPVEEQDKSNQFLYAQLKAINKLNNPAKAKRLADRVLRNRKR